MQLINTEHSFSFYNNLLSAKEPDNEFDINQLIEVIRYGYIKNEIHSLRGLNDKQEKNRLKQSKLPCVTLSGTFEKRSKQYLQEHSGLIQIDIDDLEDYDSVFNTLISDEFTFVAFRSPSGNGIKLVVKINPSIDTHLEQFLSLEKYYLDEYNIKIDSACKDIARCMLLSYDPNIYCNPFSEVYAELYIPEIKETPEKHHRVNYKINLNSNNDKDIIENLTLEIERNNIDITDGYINWIRIGFSLATALGESGRDYFHRLSRFNGGYRPRDCDKQFTNLLIRNNRAITLGTLIYIARMNGVEVIFPSQKDKKPTLSASTKSGYNKSALSEAIKRKRLELANKAGNPAYTIFSNKTLDELVERMPKTEVEFLDIYGISQKRCDAYAKDFLPIITKYKGNGTSTEKPVVQKYVIPKLKNQDERLFQELREFRLNHALEKGLKAFHVFGNTTLYEIIESKPKTKEELLDVKGIGERKLEQIGDPILEIITKYAS
ncbi:HRDC domain-containing protein [Gelidibacter maritimus]|uniref:HRDC domain-containing protein n=1 Tax=Gelidibacter maritimus TaxID=2761487 RepID=A0A7W2M476_9FLAO|nr:HRDC domain-containing protein [Gelidibacter maritimus]MBA6152401.1 HRDC domain-containing protein [Gelidibacter maritimus]